MAPTVRLPVLSDERPRVRGDCLLGGSNASRPCAWISCRHHAIDLLENECGRLSLAGEQGVSIAIDASDEEVEAFADAIVETVANLSDSCTLDVADRLRSGGTLEDAARVFKVSRERVRQLEKPALRRMRARAKRGGLV